MAWRYLRRHVSMPLRRRLWLLANPTTVEPRLTTTLSIRPRRYYIQFILAWKKAQSVIFIFKDPPVNTTHFPWPEGRRINEFPLYNYERFLKSSNILTIDELKLLGVTIDNKLIFSRIMLATSGTMYLRALGTHGPQILRILWPN